MKPSNWLSKRSFFLRPPVEVLPLHSGSRMDEDEGNGRSLLLLSYLVTRRAALDARAAPSRRSAAAIQYSETPPRSCRKFGAQSCFATTEEEELSRACADSAAGKEEGTKSDPYPSSLSKRVIEYGEGVVLGKKKWAVRQDVTRTLFYPLDAFSRG